MSSTVVVWSQFYVYVRVCVCCLKITFSQCIDSLLVFCNAHLMLSHKNKLAVIAAHANNRYWYILVF